SCSDPQSSSSHNAGNRANNVTVTVQVTCMEQVYDPKPALTLASNLLKQDIAHKLGIAYIVAGNIRTPQTNTKLVNTGVALSFTEEAIAVFHFTDAQLQGFATQLVSLSTHDARAFLSGQSGLLDFTIQLTGGDGKTFP